MANKYPLNAISNTLPMKPEDIKKQYDVLLNVIDRQKFLNIP